MAYWKDTYEFLNSNEYEYKYAGNYGAKGEKRAPKKKPTPEQIKKQNQKNRENKTRRIIKANFNEDDLWTTLKYPRGTRKQIREVLRDTRNFREAVRRYREKTGQPFKWISRIEIGRNGGIHIHMIINRVRGEPTDKLIREKWKKYGKVHFESLYEEGGYEALAEYIVKPPPEEMEGQMEMFTPSERKQLVKYSCSRNLIRPKPKRKRYFNWTVRKLIEEGPTPTPGFYIDKDSFVAGVNRYTGMSYLRYTEVRIKPVSRREGGG